jgi:hypothetical protein
MPTALEGSSRNSAEHLRKLNSRRHASSDAMPSPIGASHEATARLTRLLIAAPIDLAGISDEIRRHPDLEAIILRLGVALLLSPDEPLSTVEEAVVVLGTSRLRILIDLWSSTGAIANAASSPLNAAAAPTSASVALTPKMRYLTNFLRCLGFDSPENAFSCARLAAWATKIPPDQMFALTDIFMRDFFSLLPAIQPGIRETADPTRSPRTHST